METRRFGRTGHLSSIAILGAFAFSNVSQAETDAMMEKVIAASVNHIDVAPTYGEAEARLGSWMERERERFFLGCKTMERSAGGARAELHASLKKLRVDSFDLYQFHAIRTFEELDVIFAPGGALETFLEARQAGLVRHIGITGHGKLAPAVFLEGLRRFDFDSVLFPINPVEYGDPEYRRDAGELLRQCQEKGVGSMIIKSIAQEPWRDTAQTYNTWYRPITQQSRIQQAVNFALSQDVTGICTAGDIHLLPLVLVACQAFTPLDLQEQEALIASAGSVDTIFA